MTIERLVGLFFFIGSILILVITFYPETNSFIANDDLKDDDFYELYSRRKMYLTK